MNELAYPDGVGVELHDTVEFETFGQPDRGQVTKLFPNKATARVSFSDQMNHTKNGKPRSMSAEFRIDQLTLLRRDG